MIVYQNTEHKIKSMIVPPILIELLSRIRGAKLYHNAYMGCRVYVPLLLNYAPFKVRTKVYFEVVNDSLRLNVNVSSNDYTAMWCRQETDRIRSMIEDQFHEIIFNCELIYRNIPLAIRLKDNLFPILRNITPHLAGAVRFLCKMKVSILLSGNWMDKWFLSITLALIRYRNKRIKKLYLFLSNARIPDLEKDLNTQWPDIKLPVFLVSVESLSFDIITHEALLESVDSQTMIIIDDCHLFKSPEAVRSLRMMEIADKCNYKLMMTDSLILNNIHDIYMQYRILNKDILGYYHWEDFSKKHIIYGGIGGSQILGYKNLAYLTSLAEPYTYSMQEEENIETDLIIKTYICELTAIQKELYKKKKNELLTLIERYEIRLYDIFRIMGEMERIVCGYIPTKLKGGNYVTNKLSLFEKFTSYKSQVVVFCKYLFEIDLLINFWGRKQCAVFCGKNKKERAAEKLQFIRNNKKYLISTLNVRELCLRGINKPCEIIFFSLSFKYKGYKRELSYIRDNGISRNTSIKRFITNSGIDKNIIENLARKEKLVNQINRLFANHQMLKEFVEDL